MRRLGAVIVGVLAASALAGYGLFRLGVQHGMSAAGSTAASSPSDASGSAAKAGAPGASTARTVLYWHDPMVPGHKFDKPGKSPFMDMDLVPVYADEAAGNGTVAISPRVQQSLGVRTAEVRLAQLSSSVEAVGTVAYNERDVAVVQARGNGFLERLHVRASLDLVHRGQLLAEIYVPEWVAAQEEYLSASRIRAGADELSLGGLADAAAQRMRLAGMSDEQIRQVEADGKLQPHLRITAPISGVVSELTAREGMTVAPGTPLFRINGLSTVWVNAEIPEAAVALVRRGNAVEARTSAFPGKTFTGKVSAIVPEVNVATRTIKARIELANPGGRLVPGMFATVSFKSAARGDVLVVPSEAVIHTGKRAVVVVAQGDGRFAPVDVEVGRDNNGQTEIRSGLQAGQKVVVSGQFLVDSEASLRTSTTRMSEMPAEAKEGPSAGHGHHVAPDAKP